MQSVAAVLATPPSSSASLRRRRSLLVAIVVVHQLLVFETRATNGLFMLRPAVVPAMLRFRWLRDAVATVAVAKERAAIAAQNERQHKIAVKSDDTSPTTPVDEEREEDEARTNRRTTIGGGRRSDEDNDESLLQDLAPQAVAQIGIVMPLIAGVNPLLASDSIENDEGGEGGDKRARFGRVSKQQNDEEAYLMDVVAMTRRICHTHPVDVTTTRLASTRATRGHHEMREKSLFGARRGDVATQALIARFCHHAPMVRNG